MNKLTFIATAHNEEIYNRAFVDSMLNQTNEKFNAIVFHNGCNASMDEWVGEQNYCRWTEENGEHIKFRNSKTDTGSWGTYNRQTAINECETEYIIQTSIQDYWLPQAVEYILQGLDKQPDLLIWNSINHLVGPCQVLNSEIAWSKIDWGNFAIKTSIAKQVQIQHGQYCADWIFLKECIDRKLIDPTKVLKLNAILTIHN